MNLNGTRFGHIEYSNEDIVFFDEGLIGFSKFRHFVVVSTKEDSPFRWLQSLDDSAVAFLVVNPNHYLQDYAPVVEECEAQSLEISPDIPCVVYTTATIPVGSPSDMTLNLAAPIIINPATHKAKQLVIEDPAYTIKHRVFPAAIRTDEKQAA